MRLSKKVVLVCLFAVLAMGLVFAGGAKDDDGKVTLKILGYGANDNIEGQTFLRVCKEFMEENPDIVIDYELLYDEAYHQKAVARLAAKDVPHIASMGADARWGAGWIESKQQVNNVPYYPDHIDANLVPDFFGTGVKPYLPLGGTNFCTVVGVNTELLAKIGGKMPETYEDMKALAKLCKDNGIKCMSTHGADGWVWGSCVMSGIIPRTTGDLKWIEKACQKKAKFTDPKFVAALDVLRQWVADGVLDPESVLTDNGTGLSNFVNGKYLMYIDGQWSFGQGNLGKMVDHIQLITIPPVPGEVACQGCCAGAWMNGYGITKEATKDPKVLEAAKKWLAYFNSEEEILLKLKDGSIGAPIIKDFKTPEGMDPMVAQKAALGKYPTCYVIDSYLSGAANDILNAGMQDIVSGKQTAKDLAAAVQKAFDEQ